MSTKEETKELYADIERAGSPIKERLKQYGKNTISDHLGICSNCENLQAAETQYGSVEARCREFNKRLNAHDPIKNCTQYWNTNMPSLRELIPMAWLLDGSKRPIGFIYSDDDYECEIE